VVFELISAQDKKIKATEIFNERDQAFTGKIGKCYYKKCHAEKHPTVFCMKGKSCVIPLCGFSFCS
jgi:hypothetical protein